MNTNEPAPTARKSWPRRHKILTTLAGIAVLGTALGIVGGTTGGGQPSGQRALPVLTPNPTGSQPNPDVSTPAYTPAAAPVLHVTRVHFIVTGTGDPSITYGSDADNRDGGGTAGFMGDGNALPWRASMRFRGDAQYYSMDAQLEGSGNIHCKIVVTGPGVQTLTVSSGHASGGYSICSVQAAPSDSRGSSWQNEG
jgi:hypothetical protein